MSFRTKIWKGFSCGLCIAVFSPFPWEKNFTPKRGIEQDLSLFLTNEEEIQCRNKISKQYRTSDFYCLVHLLVLWLIEAVRQTALATIVSVKVASHEDSCSTLLRGALSAQTTDLAVLIHLSRARGNISYTHHLLAQIIFKYFSLTKQLLGLLSEIWQKNKVLKCLTATVKLLFYLTDGVFANRTLKMLGDM